MGHNLYAIFRSTPPTDPTLHPELQRSWTEKDVEFRAPEEQDAARAFVTYANIIKDRMRDIFLRMLPSILKSFEELAPLYQSLTSLAVGRGEREFPTALQFVIEKGLDAWQVSAAHHSIELSQDPHLLYVPESVAQNTLNMYVRFGYLMEVLQASGGFLFGRRLHYTPRQARAKEPRVVLDARSLWRAVLPTSLPQQPLAPSESLREIIYNRVFLEGSTHTPDRASGAITLKYSSDLGDLPLFLPPTHSAVRLRVSLSLNQFLSALQPGNTHNAERGRIARAEYTGHPITPDVVAHERAIAIQNILHYMAHVATRELIEAAENKDHEERSSVVKDIYGWLGRQFDLSPEEVQRWYKEDSATIFERSARAYAGIIEKKDLDVLQEMIEFVERRLKERGEIAPQWRAIIDKAKEGIRALRILSLPERLEKHRTLEEQMNRLRAQWCKEVQRLRKEGGSLLGRKQKAKRTSKNRLPLALCAGENMWRIELPDHTFLIEHKS